MVLFLVTVASELLRDQNRYSLEADRRSQKTVETP